MRAWPPRCALLLRFNGQEGQATSGDEAVADLQAPGGNALLHARHDVQRVAAEIRTPYCPRIEAELRWHAG